jgi:hypothetical protein
VFLRFCPVLSGHPEARGTAPKDKGRFSRGDRKRFPEGRRPHGGKCFLGVPGTRRAALAEAEDRSSAGRGNSPEAVPERKGEEWETAIQTRSVKGCSGEMRFRAATVSRVVLATGQRLGYIRRIVYDRDGTCVGCLPLALGHLLAVKEFQPDAKRRRYER